MAVDELKIQTLILCIQEYLIKYQHEFLQQNPIEILETFYHQRETFADLCLYPNGVLHSILIFRKILRNGIKKKLRLWKEFLDLFF